jgi:hypothetical protein
MTPLAGRSSVPKAGSMVHRTQKKEKWYADFCSKVMEMTASSSERVGSGGPGIERTMDTSGHIRTA